MLTNAAQLLHSASKQPYIGFYAFCLELLMQCKDLTAGSDPVINGAASPLVEAQLLGPALRGNELEIEGRGTVGP